MFGHLDKHVVCFVMISVGCNERWLVGYGTVSINQFRVTYYFILNIFYIITNKWAYVTWARVVICTMQLLHALLLHPANRHMWMKNKKMSFWLFLLILHACSAICLRFSTVWPSECHSSAAIHYRLFFRILENKMIYYAVHLFRNHFHCTLVKCREKCCALRR